MHLRASQIAHNRVTEGIVEINLLKNTSFSSISRKRSGKRTNLNCEEHVQVSVTGWRLSVLLQFCDRLNDAVDRILCQDLVDVSGIFVRIFSSEIDLDEVYCPFRDVRQPSRRRDAED